MPVTRTRRNIRRAWLAMIAVLPVWYPAAWLTVSYAVNDGIVSTTVGQSVRPAFKPLILYCDLEMPGAGTLYRLWWAVSADPAAGSQQPGWFLAPSLPRPG